MRKGLLLALCWMLPGQLFASELLRIEAGQFRPQFSVGQSDIRVHAFELTKHAVTNAQYLAFVQQHPHWRRDQIAPLFADEAYLSHWESGLILGNKAPAQAPVTNVSWFAARAYCKAKAQRLPTMAEWEWAALADEQAAQAADPRAFNARILDWYSRPTRLPLPPVGSVEKNYWGLWDMHGLVWEWVEDFNALMLTGESRQDASGADAQLFCAAGSVGSGDPANYAAFMRYAMRGSAKARYAMQNMGFRCARDIQD